MEFMSVDPVGTVGGLLCIWDPDVFQLSGSCYNRRFILLSSTLYNSFDCVLLNVYVPNDQKLKHLKVELKVWNTEVFGNITTKLDATEEELHALDRIAEERVLHQSEMARKREARYEVWKLYISVEWLWHQQSKMNWSLHGDKNTRFFHAVASTRHNWNMINSISVNGVSLEEPSRVKHEVFLHFKKHFKESWVNRPVLGGEFKLIEGTISYHLVSDFTKAEVWAAIKESNSNKAPGPDGFNLLCYQKFWRIMKQEIMQFF
ncbi:uncharacterized protein LOC114259592 [Camellia sinensis]|uniref:uncharacterized protein LOC114259592 n=1 Tax=Camellia sinensis TaxID=4442 RepID=UPI001036E56C|nr:uncharacterized protein LOC114259592 [Camellia sinensis]